MRSCTFGACTLIAASVLPQGSAYGFCLSGHSCFPSESTLAQLNASVSGRLYTERPVGSVCYEGDPNFNQAACNDVANKTSSSNWRVERFPAYQFTNWEECNLGDCNATTVVRDRVCAQGRIPSYAIHAETAQDAVEYVRFATKHNLRMVIKNTGHDMLGRSSGKGGFGIWTHKMKGMHYSHTFVPEGCSKEVYKDVVTLDAGVQWGEAYKFADSMNLTIVGGGASSVGAAGGYALGAGYSLLSPSLGLALNNIVEVELVTADGQLRMINECSDPDLFWAARGGGGGTWGVTTKVAYKTHPRSALHAAIFNIPIANMSDTSAREAITRWVKLAPTLGDLGIGGVTTLSGDVLSITAMTQSSFVDLPQLKNVLEPYTSWLLEQGLLAEDPQSTVNGTSIGYVNFANYYDFFSGTAAADNSAGGAGTISSRLVPRHYYESDPEGLADILMEGTKGGGSVIIGAVGPLRYVKDHPDAVNVTSVTPVWYQSPWHIISGVTPRLREYAKDGGAYFGESDVNEPNAADAYWGSNYPALLRAKAKWDPDNVFEVWHGVGSPTLGNGTQSACA